MFATQESRSRLAIVLSVFVGAVFFLAAAMKAWNGYHFISVLMYLLPEPLNEFDGARGVAISVIAWEALLGALLVSGRQLKCVLVATGATLVFFSGVLGYLLTRSDAPGCGCLGLMLVGRAAHGDAWLGLARNAALISMLGILVTESRGDREDIDVAVTFSNRTGKRAFTLIEMLVSISIVAVLLALAIPSLGAARYSARQTRSLATQRQLVAATHAYLGDFKEAFPYMATPGQAIGGVSIRGFVIADSRGCFADQAWHWTSLIVPDYLPCDRSAIEQPEAREYLRYLGYPEQVIRSRYFISYNTFAGAPYWAASQAGDPVDLHATGLRDVAHPSRKGLILDTAIGMLVSERGVGGRSYCAALVDGSARTFEDSQVDDENLVIPNYLPGRHPVLSTRHGLSGIDF